MRFPPTHGCAKCQHPPEDPFCCTYCHARNLIARKESLNAMIRKVKTELKIKGNMYFITFTSTQEPPGEVVQNWIKFCKKFKVVKDCVELTESGLPHIHGLIETDKYLDYRRVARANKGMRVDVQKAKYLQAVNDYITKEETKPPESWWWKWRDQLVAWPSRRLADHPND